MKNKSLMIILQILVIINYYIINTNSFILQSKILIKRLNLQYAVTQNRVISTINQDFYIKQKEYNEIKTVKLSDETTTTTISLLNFNEIDQAATMVTNVHYTQSIYYTIIKNIIKNMIKYEKINQNLNNWLDRKDNERKDKLCKQISYNLLKRSGERLNSYDLSDNQLSVIIIAKKNNEIIGLIEVWPQPFDDNNNDKNIYVCNLSVKQESRGIGIGRELHKASEILAKKWGKLYVCLDVERNNYNARKFYNKLGYKDKYSNSEIISRFISLMNGENKQSLIKKID